MRPHLHRTGTAARLPVLLGAVLLLAGCAGAGTAPASPSPSVAEATPEHAALPELDAAGLEAIGATEIFFAHRSVGAEIVEQGIPAVYGDFGLEPPGASFADHWLDQTEDPASKLADFDRWIRDEGVGASARIAFMKLGYVDILADTDVGGVFDRYQAMMAALEADHPDVVFLHATVSVTAWEPENNAAIERFNTLMRDRYAPTARLFDLAAVVSTCSDGTTTLAETAAGEPYYRICDEYTRDGGHLSELGAKVAADRMLRLLASVAPVTR